jgi:hypothetical protein
MLSFQLVSKFCYGHQAEAREMGEKCLLCKWTQEADAEFQS